MTNTFTASANRKDASLTVFQADDNAVLLRAISTNSSTAHVRQLRQDGPISVPNRAAARVREHLVKLGWTEA